MNEARNTIIDDTQPAPAEESKKVPSGDRKRDRRFSGSLKSLLEGSWLVREKVVKLLPYLMFLTALGLIYIFSTNYANRTVINISRTKKMNEELRFSYITTRSQLMQSSRQSEIAHKLETRGIKESKVPPRKIIITTH